MDLCWVRFRQYRSIHDGQQVMIITFSSLDKVAWPIYLLPHEDWSFSDGLMFFEGVVVDDRNMEGETLGVRRLQTTYPSLWPLKRQVDTMQGMLKQNTKCFIDSKGRPFIYEKTTMCSLKWLRIKKKELREEYCLLWIEGVSTPFSVPRPPEATMAFAGILHFKGLPWVLYEYSDVRKKNTWRKV